jgi:isopenicillin N synthase-like dioxygenase
MAATEPEAGPVAMVGGFVPVVDLGQWYADDGQRQALALAIGRACEVSGFLVIVNHGMPPEVIARLDRATRAFFAQPRGVKELLAADPRDFLMRGYGSGEGADGSSPGTGGAGEVRVEVGHLETFVMNRLGEPGLTGPVPAGADPSLYARNRWPLLPGFREAYLAFYAVAERLAMEIMRIFALALDLPEGWFDDKFDRHMTSLAANFYPSRALAPGVRLRKGEHTDWGTLTILHKDESAAGLEVLDRSGQWHEVPAVAGSLVINLGDLMTVWTNDRWASTVHRVVYPRGADAERERYSVAFFHQPNHDALIECIPACAGRDRPPRHPPVRFGDYLSGKARRAFMHRYLGRDQAEGPRR